MVSHIELFLEFLKIGFIMFGGGYGGIGLIYRELVDNKKWVSEEEFLRILAIAESTPGPIAINSAAWIGYTLKGFSGSIIATLAVVLPAYLVTLGAVLTLRPYLEHEVAKAIFKSINAAITALILYAFIKLAKTTLFIGGEVAIDVIPLVAFLLSLALLLLTRVQPIIVIGLAALIGLVAKLLT